MWCIGSGFSFFSSYTTNLASVLYTYKKMSFIYKINVHVQCTCMYQLQVVGCQRGADSGPTARMVTPVPSTIPLHSAGTVYVYLRIFGMNTTFCLVIVPLSKRGIQVSSTAFNFSCLLLKLYSLLLVNSWTYPYCLSGLPFFSACTSDVNVQGFIWRFYLGGGGGNMIDKDSRLSNLDSETDLQMLVLTT